MNAYVLILLLISVTAKVLYPSDYFPLAVGNQWKYNLYDSSGGFLCTDSQFIVSDSIADNNHLFAVDQVHCFSPGDPSSRHFLFSDGDTVKLYMPAIGNPIRGLHNFYDGQIIYLPFLQRTDTIRYVGAVTVLAGTFDSCYCWRTTQGAEYYAPNVGMIKAVDSTDKVQKELSYYVVNLNAIEIKSHLSSDNCRLMIKPNPCSNIVGLSSKSYVGKISVSILNAQGFLMDRFILFNTPGDFQKVDISNYSLGVYFCKVIFSNKCFYGKFVKTY
jgi:hypothetical protein